MEVERDRTGTSSAWAFSPSGATEGAEVSCGTAVDDASFSSPAWRPCVSWLPISAEANERAGAGCFVSLLKYTKPSLVASARLLEVRLAGDGGTEATKAAHHGAVLGGTSLGGGSHHRRLLRRLSRLEGSLGDVGVVESSLGELGGVADIELKER